ncbi:FAD-dependent oxidoreductase [bacterium]|nr:MAG: FAD-dependent oxidoreductase [bacterium]
MDRYDLIVIGAGMGGVSTAFTAAEQGMRVALVERAKIGGT